MTKTKLKVTVLGQGNENDYIIRAIASHNEGKSIISLPDLISWGVMRSAIYQTVPVSIDRDRDDENIVIVTDNGKTTLIIEEVMYYELETEPNDLKDINI